MAIEAILYAFVASIVYMLVYWLPKRIDTTDPQELDMKKVIRTLVWGLILGAVIAYIGVEPEISILQSWSAKIMGYGVLVALVDKATLFLYRLLQSLKEKAY